MKPKQSKSKGEGFLIASGSQVGISGTTAAFIINQKSETRFIIGALPLAKVHPRVDDLNLQNEHSFSTIEALCEFPDML